MEVDSYMDSKGVAIAFGKRIRKLKNEKQIHINDIAYHTGLSCGYCYDIMNGKRNPSLYVIVCLAHSLDLTVSDLFFDFENFI